jgi:hypothetical protein
MGHVCLMLHVLLNNQYWMQLYMWTSWIELGFLLSLNISLWFDDQNNFWNANFNVKVLPILTPFVKNHQLR